MLEECVIFCSYAGDAEIKVVARGMPAGIKHLTVSNLLKYSLSNVYSAMDIWYISVHDQFVDKIYTIQPFIIICENNLQKKPQCKYQLARVLAT